MRRVLRRWISIVAVCLAAPVALIGLPEIYLVLCLEYPALTGISTTVRKAVRAIYRHVDRTVVQYDPDCARYDPEVMYTLRPGSCVVENREHTVTYTVNSAGLRDSEEALRAPQVIVIGDSHAMGWGVAQEETFAHRLRALTGRRLLNASISSYGTAREFLILARLDTAALETLVITYSENDAPENRFFVDNGFELKIRSREEWTRLAAGHMRRRRYPYPLFFTLRTLARVRQSPATAGDTEPVGSMHRSAARDVLAILRHAAGRLEGVTVVLLEINGYNANDSDLVEALREELRQAPLPFLAQVIILDSSTFLTDADYFILDDHMNASGHAEVASQIAAALQK